MQTCANLKSAVDRNDKSNFLATKKTPHQFSHPPGPRFQPSFHRSHKCSRERAGSRPLAGVRGREGIMAIKPTAHVIAEDKETGFTNNFKVLKFHLGGQVI